MAGAPRVPESCLSRDERGFVNHILEDAFRLERTSHGLILPHARYAASDQTRRFCQVLTVQTLLITDTLRIKAPRPAPEPVVTVYAEMPAEAWHHELSANFPLVVQA